ncbi:MAG: GntR family transcriptional regulator [Steroidobacteraceae bacterium]|jgi:DNA-binding GntR family transcriptional regulator
MAAARSRNEALPPRLAQRNAQDRIYEKIQGAILEHRLHPGTKLAEERLAAIFDVSRARIREVLARLAHEQIVEVIPQRGAFVAKPSIEQAMHVFEARRLIEPALMKRLIDVLTPEHVQQLRRHLALEEDARRRGDKRAIVRLSGDFHILVADLAGNRLLARQMRELSSLTCLIIYLYDAPTATSCRADEHAQIVESVARRDLPRAQALMLDHLAHIEQSLTLESTTSEVDFEAIFSD